MARDLGFPTIPGTEPVYSENNLQFDVDPETQQRRQRPVEPPPPYTYEETQELTPASDFPQAEVGAYSEDDYGAEEAENESDWGPLYTGTTQSGFLLAFVLLGAGADSWLKEKTGVSGYGPVLGATVGSVVNSVSSLEEADFKDRAKAFGGALIPVIPLLAAVGLKKEISGGTRSALLLTSVGLTAASIYLNLSSKKTNKRRR